MTRRSLSAFTGALALGAVLLLGATPVSAAIIQYKAILAPEALGATGTGNVLLTYDDVLLTMRLQVTFSGLSGTTTAAHVHCCTATPGVGNAGVATMTPSFVGFPLGVTSGTMDQTYDMTLASSFNTPFVTNNGGTTTTARAALLTGIDAGKAYFNIHTNTFGGGEIRGFLAPVPVPEPGSLALLGLAAVAIARRRARS